MKLGRLFGAIVAGVAAAASVKVVKDILKADEEEKNIINLETEQPNEVVSEEQPTEE